MNDFPKIKKPLGIKLISAYFLFSVIFSILGYGVTLYSQSELLHLPKEVKIKMLQSSQMKALKINTTEEYDNYVLNEIKLKKPILVELIIKNLITSILLFGFWNLKNWGRVGLIILVVYNFTVLPVYIYMTSSIRGLKSVPQIGIFTLLFGFLFGLAIAIWIIVYLTCPKVKEQFR
jgi:hypothetical protein